MVWWVPMTILLPQSNCVSSVTSLKSDWLQLKEHTDQTSTLTATYTLTATLVRAQVLPTSDLYICGSVATRTDADVLYSLSQTARDTIHRQADRFSLCCQWLNKIGIYEPASSDLNLKICLFGSC